MTFTMRPNDNLEVLRSILRLVEGLGNALIDDLVVS